MHVKKSLVYLLPNPPIHSKVLIVSATTSANGETIVRTDPCIFHPQGGGQRADVGTIGGFRVLDAHKTSDGDVEIALESAAAGLVQGQFVDAKVDDDVRRSNAALHTAGHVLANVVEQRFPALKATGGHHWKDEARVVFTGPLSVPIEQFVNIIQKDLAAAINADMLVAVLGDPHANREIKIGELASLPCGGVHLARTGQLSHILIRKVKLAGKELRISYDASPVTLVDEETGVVTTFAP
ncbi:MAG: hypothetical protein SGJ19_05165 [Planctomycetia bacterium]|nr:hypothetical protein [Planctomycetia bacterium]